MSDQPISYTYRELFSDAWKFIRLYQGRFWLGTIFRFSTDILALYMVYVMAEALAFFANYKLGDSTRVFWIYLGLWCVTQSIILIFRQLGKFSIYQVGEKMQLDAQLQALTHLSKLDISWHEQENTGNKLKRIQNGGNGLNRLVRIWVDHLIQIVVNIVGMTIILSRVEWRVGVILLIFFTTYLMISIPLQR